MAAASLWVFEQLGGERRRLELADHAAPHGRPRQKPVVEHRDVYRQAKTYYQGSPVPTRHVFGQKHDPVTLNGRFRDRWGGVGFAKAKMAEVREFAKAQQPVRATWSSLVSMIVFFTSVQHGIESEGEIAWELELDVDEDLILGRTPTRAGQKFTIDFLTSRIQDALKAANQIPYTPPTLKGSTFDLLSGLVGSVNAATAYLIEVSNEIDSLVNAPFQQVARLRAGLGQVRVAISNLRHTYDNLQVHLALEGQAWTDDETAFYRSQAGWGDSSLKALRELAAAERAAARAQRGAIKELYTAKDGDSWDAIAVHEYGSADRASEISRANGVPDGQQPDPGTAYVVPR